MEQNLVSDEELIERINKVLSETKGQKSGSIADIRQDSSGEKFHDVFDTTEEDLAGSEKKIHGEKKNLALENHYLALQLQEEKKKSKELQSKYKLFENSIKYFERLNGQLETIKKAVDEEHLDIEKNSFLKYDSEAMQKIRPKTIHTAPSGGMSNTAAEAVVSEAANFSEPHSGETKKVHNPKTDQEEVVFREAEDFKQLEHGLEIVKDKVTELDSENEKVFITKTEKKCLEDIGNIAARTRAPLDDKHQRYFEKDRRKFANSITMPDIQEVEKGEPLPPEIISKTKETPVNITSTELDGLRSYLLQLKELIARRETAWARTTERDYNQRVEITRFKNEVSHLRMLCDKRQKEIKERDQMILTKDEEIRDLQKRVQALKNAVAKLEKKEEKLMDLTDGGLEVPDNVHLVQKSYNAMKRQSAVNRANISSSMNLSSAKQSVNVNVIKPFSPGKDFVPKAKPASEKVTWKKVKASESTSNEEDSKLFVEKSKVKGARERKPRHRSDSLVHKPKDSYDKVDEKLQRVEEMLHNEVLRGTRKSMSHAKSTRNQTDLKTLLKNSTKAPDYPSPVIKKLTPSNSTIRQEMLTVMSGLNSGSNRGANFPNTKKNPTAAIIANALLAARNVNLFNL